ncbi:hypothetical protein MHO82_20220 [Vibrio sp. Of7-15]|uniref:hypothetical protein n=1 Tax=Vibrio sp. Of7-15 TaxID=2724879 RepID=UPI001EF33ECD|nr:hypothetical protein [Vibrio sp. Of7-15]MCG7499196.1 hypothetical protein [Vibrio sp. Of7-15]
MNTKQRIVSLDFLRGLMIFMAVFEHYTGYLNYWYIDFFIRERSFSTLGEPNLLGSGGL